MRIESIFERELPVIFMKASKSKIEENFLKMLFLNQIGPNNYDFRNMKKVLVQFFDVYIYEFLIRKQSQLKFFIQKLL